MHLSSSTPSIVLKVRNEFLYNQKSGWGEYTNGWLVGIRTVKGYATTFYVLLENGVLFTGLPVHALCHMPCEALHLSEAQMWDNISYDHQIFEINFLKGMSLTVLLKNRQKEAGTYLFSLDFSNAYSLAGRAETPHEWKCFHFIKLNSGNFCLYPQNRILFKDASLIVPNNDTIKYQVNMHPWACEDGNKWTVGMDSNYMYEEDKVLVK